MDKPKNITIFRTYVSEDARIDREELGKRLAEAGLDSSKAKIISRKERDGLRFAVRDMFSRTHSYTDDQGRPCKLLVSEARQSTADVRLDVHSRADGMAVEYSDLLCSFELRGSDVQFIPAPGCWGVLNKVGIMSVDPNAMLREGMNMLYSRDIRKCIASLIPQAEVKAWKGVYFSFGSPAGEIRSVRDVFSRLPEGQAQISALTLEYTPENTAQLAEDMAESFRDRFKSLLEQLRAVGPNLEAIRRDFDALLVAHAEMEKQLDQAIDIYVIAGATEFVLKMKEEEEQR